MSLRLRVAFLFSLLLGATTLVLGLGLRWGLERRLLERLDADLAAAMGLARPLVGLEPEEGVVRLLPDRALEALPRLLPELVLVLVSGDGVKDALGRLPDWETLASLGHPHQGYSFWNGWRLF
ncbi:MAG: sensor histidine kinase, partial [Thermus sp.]